MTVGDERLGLLRELERADEAVAAELAEIDELATEVVELHERALELQAFFARLPEERTAAAEAVAEAQRALAEARAAAEHAADQLARAEAERSPERLAEARRFELRANDSLHMAERRSVLAEERAAELDVRAAAAEQETAILEARGSELAAALAVRPRLAGDAVARLATGVAGVAEWGTQARATLLVARSQLTAERDAVVRQANELGAVVLGEALPSLGAAAVARRVEHELHAR